VIISDINMPEMNGLEMLQAIRTGKGAVDRAVPVVMLTAHSEAMVVGTALRLDASGFVVKPASGKHLGDRIERALAEPLSLKPAEKYAAVTIPVVDTYGTVHMPDDLAKAWKEMSGEAPGPVAKTKDKIALADLTPGMVVGDWVTTAGTASPVLAPGTVLTDHLIVRLADLVEAGAIPHTIPISQD
jgi:DNA-binding NarL/FixJ family response regulator